ncbi:MAG: transporter substrate-binding domain-containing protein [Methylococcaceae bacterium]|nr:transporter substrate-binding domain-containing protein [Methylococcaceae bacterium]
MKLNVFFIGLCLFVSCNSFAAEKTTIRIGVQASGTLEWELSALQDDPQVKSADFQLEIQHVANAEAGKIALQSGAVDMIVSDWIWVSSLRTSGTDFTFYPYSTTSGALVVAGKSPIHFIKDLKGKRLGIAGGELDKNWLLLQALAQKEQLDLNASVEKTFGAPPLMNEQIKQNRVDAVLTYWHFAARLEAQGYRQIIDGRGILKGLGIDENVPNIGYVFKQSWAESHKEAINSFFKASKQAKNRLCTSDAAWQKVIPLTQTDDLPTQTKLRQRYCEGGIEQWGEKEQQAAARIYGMLRTLSDNRLTGQSAYLQPGTFWSYK